MTDQQFENRCAWIAQSIEFMHGNEANKEILLTMLELIQVLKQERN